MSDQLASIRDIAILISSLDADAADRLLEQLTEEESDRVRSAILDLDKVSSGEENETIARFLGNEVEVEGAQTDVEEEVGVELDFDPESIEELVANNRAPSTPTFQIVHEAEAATLARLLANEHPQTTAVVLAHISPQRAGELLLRLPVDVQTNVLKRMADMDTTDPVILQAVEETLNHLLSDHVDLRGRRRAGIQAIDAILKTVSRSGRDRVIEDLSAKDRNLAKSLALGGEVTAMIHTHEQHALEADSGGKESKSPNVSLERDLETEVDDDLAVDDLGEVDDEPLLSFSDLVLLDDDSLATLIRKVNPQICLLALAGATVDFVDRIMSQLPDRTAKKLRRQIERIGPIRLEDVELAQLEMAEVCARLARSGAIAIPASKRFSIAV